MSALTVPVARLLPPVSDLRSERDPNFLDRLAESLQREAILHPVRALKEVIDHLLFYRTLTAWPRTA